MDAQTFWNVIGIYNQQTVAVQIVLFLFAVIAAVLSYSHKVKWAAKFALGIIHLFIGIVFFAWHGVEPIQKYFALPLYLLCGFLFLYESWHNRNDSFVAFCFCMKAGIIGMIYLKNLMVGNVCC